MTTLPSTSEFEAKPELRDIADVLLSSRRILLAGHLSPDHDTLASTLAVGAALRAFGKDVVTFNADGVPPNMRFLPYSEGLASELSDDERFDATLVLDSSSPDRFGPIFASEASRARLGRTLRIDHHVAQSSFTELTYLDSTRASTGELAFELLKTLGGTITREMALCLYCALVSDTGGFRYANTDARAFAAASELLAYDINPWEVTTRLYESRPLAELKILGDVLNTLELSHGGRLATLVVTQEMLVRNKAEVWMLDGFVNMGRAVEGVEVAVLIRERSTPGQYKLSLRSKGRVDVAPVAQRLGGGGHKNAAGCFITGSIESIKAELSRIADELLP